MVDLKTICSDGGRIRTASISSMGGITSENSAASLRYIDSFQQPNKILEESGSEYHLEHSSSSDSLDNFADLLGEDTEDDIAPRTSLKSQGSNVSSEFNSNFSLHDNDRISAGGDLRGMDDALSMTSQSSGSSNTRLNIANNSPHLSQQSNKSFKNRPQYSNNGSNQDITNTGLPDNSNHTEVGSTAITDSKLTVPESETDKRLSGLAGEIFALLNMK